MPPARARRFCGGGADGLAHGKQTRTNMTGYAAEQLLVLYNPLVRRAIELAAEIRMWAGAQVPTLSVDDPAVRDLVRAHDLVVALGGDGTMLRAGRLTAPHGGQVLFIAPCYCLFLAGTKVLYQNKSSKTDVKTKYKI